MLPTNRVEEGSQLATGNGLETFNWVSHVKEKTFLPSHVMLAQPLRTVRLYVLVLVVEPAYSICLLVYHQYSLVNEIEPPHKRYTFA